MTTPLQDGPGRSDGPGWSWLAVAAAGYLGCLAAALPTVFAGLGRTIPGGGPDPSIHLWTMRWYEHCLRSGRPPFFSDGLAFPVGLPTGLNPSLHLPAIEFLLLGAATRDDALRYGIVWILAFLSTGLGTAWLAWWAVRDRASAWLAGLMAMLSAPMVLHGHGHIELIQAGSIPVFLRCWLDWMERPGGRRLAAAAASYLLVAMSAQYFALMVVIPACVAAAFAAARFDGGAGAWVRSRLAGLAGFSGVAACGIALLYCGQLLAMATGTPMSRPKSQFDAFGAPWWSYLVPIPGQGLDTGVGASLYAEGSGVWVVEMGSYLGLAMLGLLAIAAACRVRFRIRGLWWTLLAVVVVLSFGSALEVGGHAIPMPSALLRRGFPPVRLTRVPARYNLLAVVIGAVIAAAAARSILARIPRRAARAALVAAAVGLILADQGHRRFPCSAPAPAPVAYSQIAAARPGASLLEIPQGSPDSEMPTIHLMGQLAYWQSHHRLRSSALYSAVGHRAFGDLVAAPSPFLDSRLKEPGYAEGDGDAIFPGGRVRSGSLRDLAWLYTRVHGYDYLVLHTWFAGHVPAYRAPLGRLGRLLAEALVHEDDVVTVLDARRLAPPSRPTALPTSGWSWGHTLGETPYAAVSGEATLAVYIPEGAGPCELAVGAMASQGPRRLRLRSGGTILADWVAPPEGFATRISPPFALTAGHHDLTLEVLDRDDLARPGKAADVPVGIAAVLLRPAEARALARKHGAEPR